MVVSSHCTVFGFLWEEKKGGGGKRVKRMKYDGGDNLAKDVERRRTLFHFTVEQLIFATHPLTAVFTVESSTSLVRTLAYWTDDYTRPVKSFGMQARREEERITASKYRVHNPSPPNLQDPQDRKMGYRPFTSPRLLSAESIWFSCRPLIPRDEKEERKKSKNGHF